MTEATWHTTFRGLESAAERLYEYAVELELAYRMLAQERKMQRAYSPAEAEAYERQHRPAVEKEFADVPGLFKEFLGCPDPDDFAEGITTTAAVLAELAGPAGQDDFTDGTSYPPNSAFDQLDNLSGYLDSWTGEAAMTFDREYVAKLPRVLWHQFAAVAALRGALLAEQAMWAAARQDICDLLDKTDLVLDSLSEYTPEEAKLLISLVAAVVAVAAVPITGGSSAAILFAAAAAAATVTKDVISLPPKQQDPVIRGHTPAQVIGSMRAAIKDLKKGLVDTERFICDRLTETWDAMQKPDGTFFLPRPDLADATADNVADPAHMGHPA